MTEQRMQEAQARLDAMDARLDVARVSTGEFALFLVMNHMDTGVLTEALVHAPEDLRDALAALRRVRAELDDVIGPGDGRAKSNDSSTGATVVTIVGRLRRALEGESA